MKPTIDRIQRLLLESEQNVADAIKALKAARHAQKALHEMAAEVLQSHGSALGLTDGDIAQTLSAGGEKGD